MITPAEGDFRLDNEAATGRLGAAIAAVFAVFSVAFLGETLRWNFLAAGACLVAAVVFIFLPVE